MPRYATPYRDEFTCDHNHLVTTSAARGVEGGGRAPLFLNKKKSKTVITDKVVLHCPESKVKIVYAGLIIQL